VRVELSHDVTDDTGALAERFVGAVTTVVHRVNHSAVYGLESVTNFWQGATDNNAHRVVEVRPLHFKLEVDLLNAVARGV
jgi:hypothetical protein